MLLLHNSSRKKTGMDPSDYYTQNQDCSNSVMAESAFGAKTKSSLLQSLHYSSKQQSVATVHPLAPCFDHEQTTRYIVERTRTPLSDCRSMIIYIEPLSSPISNLATGSILNIPFRHFCAQLQVGTPYSGNVSNIWMGVKEKRLLKRSKWG